MGGGAMVDRHARLPGNDSARRARANARRSQHSRQGHATLCGHPSPDLGAVFNRNQSLSQRGGHEMKLHKRGVALVVALAGILLLAAPALAADHERIAGSGSFTDTSSCADPIQVDFSYDEMMHTY